MAWIQIKFAASAQDAESIGDHLTELGAQAVIFQDAKDTPIFEPGVGETPLWQQNIVIGLFNAEDNLSWVTKELQQQPTLGPDFRYKIEQLEDKDWQDKWMDYFHPMQFGKRLWVCPSWREIPDPEAVNIMLDPGLAFGTGTHPTTALCLEYLDGIDLSDKTVVDFGCGSGILAIAALKLGAKRAIGIDIDPQAIQSSRDNAERNGVADKLELYLPQDQPADLAADVVVANILAGPLCELSGLIKELVKPQGHLALSGVLDSQVAEVQSAYIDQIQLDETPIREEWARISGQKI